MATATVDESTGGERYSKDIPSKILGPVPIKDLPEPLPLRKVLGPGVILLATALGSGEYVLWPFIASHIGLTILWAAIVAIAIQFFINMEVERWTLATGETAITGFTRLWKPWWFLFIIMAVVPNMWPGFATGAATCLSFVVGDLNIQLVGILGLIAVGITLTASPVVYQTVERLQTVVIGAVIIWLALAVVLGTTGDAWGDLVSGFGSFGSIETSEAVTAAALAGAIAFAGSGGCGNLAVSNWVRDKGMGMGHYIPRIVSPMSGEQEALPSTGNTFETNDENMRRWRGWWKVANTEQAVTFWLIGTAGIVILSVLAYSTVFGKDTGEDFDFIKAEGEVLSRHRGALVRDRVLARGLLQAALDDARQLRLRQPHHGRRGEDQRDARQQHLDREPHLRGDRLGPDRLRHRDPADLHRPAARAAGDRLRAQRDGDVHLLDPADRAEPQGAAGHDPHQRLPARDPGRRGDLVRLLLGARADRLHPAALGRMTKPLRLRLLLAVSIWLLLISLVKLVDLVA